MRMEAPFEEVIRVKDQFYVLATSPMIDGRTQALKQGETFAVLDWKETTVSRANVECRSLPLLRNCDVRARATC